MRRSLPKPATYHGEVYTLIDVTYQGGKVVAHLIPSTSALDEHSPCVFVDLTEVQI